MTWRCASPTCQVPNEETQTLLPPRKKHFWTKKSFVVSCLLFVLILISLIVLVTERMIRVQHLEDALRNKENRSFVHHSEDLVGKTNELIEQLNKTLHESYQTVEQLTNVLQSKTETIEFLNQTLVNLTDIYSEATKQRMIDTVDLQEKLEQLNSSLIESHQHYTDLIIQSNNARDELNAVIKQLTNKLRASQKPRSIHALYQISKRTLFDRFSSKE